MMITRVPIALVFISCLCSKVYSQDAMVLSGSGNDNGFGISVALDGNRLVIGTLAQSAYIFERDGDTWTEVERLVASDGVPGIRFGVTVALSGDRVLIGAPGQYGSDEYAGAASVYDWGDNGLVEKFPQSLQYFDEDTV